MHQPLGEHGSETKPRSNRVTVLRSHRSDHYVSYLFAFTRIHSSEVLYVSKGIGSSFSANMDPCSPLDVARPPGPTIPSFPDFSAAMHPMASKTRPG